MGSSGTARARNSQIVAFKCVSESVCVCTCVKETETERETDKDEY